MRTSSLLLSALLATPLAAQSPDIGPEPSVLFAPSEQSDSSASQRVRSRGGRGALIGGVLGFGIAMAGRVKSGDGGLCDASAPPVCRDALNYGVGTAVFAGVAGAALGYMVDRSLPPRRTASPSIAPAPSPLFAPMAELVHSAADTTAEARPATNFQNAISIFGGGVAGVGAYAFLSQEFRGPCPDSPDTPCPADRVPAGWRLAGAAVSGTAGYLVTRGMTGAWSKPRTPRAVETGVPREETGLNWWQGGIVGAGLGALTTTFLVHGLHAGNEMQLTDGQAALVFAPLGALIGFVVGGSHAQGR